MIVVDIETTGLDPKKNSIIEIGAIDFNNPENIFDQRCKIRENTLIDARALEINGYSNDELLDDSQQSVKELLLNFIEWIKDIDDRTLAGHNVSFDLSFLNENIKLENIDWNFGRRIIDQHALAYASMLANNVQNPLRNNTSSLSGDDIMEYVGLLKEPIPHKGINGAKFEAEVISRIIFGKYLLKEFKVYKLPEYLKIE